jgi:putative glutamine amidotransferase
MQSGRPRAPIIGITGAATEVTTAIGPISWTGVSSAYVEAVERAGGLPVVLPVLDPGAAARVVERVDGLVVSGGGDIDPSLYGEQPQADELYGISAPRDAFEHALLTQAYESRRPVLAICRGMQMLNVVFGGTLIQHLPNGEITHQDRPNAHQATHTMTIETDTNLGRIVGAHTLPVNSLHHQAVKTLGPSLRVSAFADDGVIEAIEIDDRPDIVGVQWHPELLQQTEGHRRLFEWLVDRASTARRD